MATDDLVGAVSGFVKRLLRRLPLAKLYPGTVKAQDASSLLVDVLPDDAKELGGAGFSGIRLALGLPGFKVKVPAGARLRLWWDAWDPSRPFAGLFDEGGPVTEVSFDGGTKGVARVDDTVDCGKLRYVPGSPGALFYTPPGGVEAVVSAVPPGTSISGIVTSGSAKLKA